MIDNTFDNVLHPAPINTNTNTTEVPKDVSTIKTAIDSSQIEQLPKIDTQLIKQ